MPETTDSQYTTIAQDVLEKLKDPKYAGIAHDIFEEMKDVHPSDYQAYLARWLEELFA